MRQCVCDFSGFSKRIPRPEHPRVACTFPIGQKIYRMVILIRPRRKEGIFIELILETYQSPHTGSKLCFAKGTQLRNIAEQSSEDRPLF